MQKDKPKQFFSVEKESKPIPKRKIFFWAGIIFWLLLGTIVIVKDTKYFIDTHDFRPPVQVPWTEKLTPTPVASKSAMVQVAYAEVKPTEAPVKSRENISQMLSGIYILESSAGKNDGCRDSGQYNGYGYGQSTHTWNCFSSPEEVEAKVSNWIQDKLDKGFSEGELLCYYNEGIRKSDCSYYQKCLSLKGGV